MNEQLKDSLKKQYNIGSWWGSFKLLGQHVSSYVQFVNLGLLVITAYYTSISPYLHSVGINIPFIPFILIVVAGLLILFFLEYKLSFPSFFGVWNEQWWSHNNPMKNEVEKLHAENARLSAGIAELKAAIDKITPPAPLQ